MDDRLIHQPQTYQFHPNPPILVGPLKLPSLTNGPQHAQTKPVSEIFPTTQPREAVPWSNKTARCVQFLFVLQFDITQDQINELAGSAGDIPGEKARIQTFTRAAKHCFYGLQSKAINSSETAWMPSFVASTVGFHNSLAYIHNLQRQIDRLCIAAADESQSGASARQQEKKRIEQLFKELKANMVQSYDEEINRVETKVQSPFRFGERNAARLNPMESAACISIERQRLMRIRQQVVAWPADTTSTTEIDYYHQLAPNAKLTFWRERTTPEILGSMFRPCLNIFDFWATCYDGGQPTAFGTYAIHRFCRTCTDMAAFVCRPRSETMALANHVNRSLRASADYNVDAGPMYRASRRLFTEYNAALAGQDKAPITIADVLVLQNASLDTAGNRQTANVLGGAGGDDNFLWDL